MAKEYWEMIRIEKLQQCVRTLLALHDEDPAFVFATAIEQVEYKLREAYREAGWHCVSHIVNGCANEDLFTGPLDNCREYVSILVEGFPEYKGNIIITQL